MEQSKKLLEYIGDMNALVDTEVTVAFLDCKQPYRETGIILGPEHSAAFGKIYVLLPAGPRRFTRQPIALDTDANIYSQQGEIVATVATRDLP